jgi:hypothetical protein
MIEIITVQYVTRIIITKANITPGSPLFIARDPALVGQLDESSINEST